MCLTLNNENDNYFIDLIILSCVVTVGEVPISSIGRGLCVLLGISMEDTQKDVDYM